MTWLLVHYEPAKNTWVLLFWFVFLTEIFCLLRSLLVQQSVIAAHRNKGLAAMAYQPLKILLTSINRFQKEKEKHFKNSVHAYGSPPPAPPHFVINGEISCLCLGGYLSVFRNPFGDRQPTYMVMNERGSWQKNKLCPTTISSNCMLPGTLLACVSQHSARKYLLGYRD